MTDIVARLRDGQAWPNGESHMRKDAANEIEKLLAERDAAREEVARLRGRLRNIRHLAEWFDPVVHVAWNEMRTIRELAEAALRKAGEPGA